MKTFHFTVTPAGTLIAASPEGEAWLAKREEWAATTERERIRQELEDWLIGPTGPADAGLVAGRRIVDEIRRICSDALRDFARRLETPTFTASAYVNGERVERRGETPEAADTELARRVGLEPAPADPV